MVKQAGSSSLAMVRLDDNMIHPELKKVNRTPLMLQQRYTFTPEKQRIYITIQASFHLITDAVIL